MGQSRTVLALCAAIGRNRHLSMGKEASVLRCRKPEQGDGHDESRNERTRRCATRCAQHLPRWTFEDGWIRRTYKTNSWKGTLMVINAVGHLAEAAWHHPDITASYAWVEVRLMTHDRQGHHRQGLRARPEDRGGGGLAAGHGRRRRSKARRRTTRASPTSSTKSDRPPRHRARRGAVPRSPWSGDRAGHDAPCRSFASPEMVSAEMNTGRPRRDGPRRGRKAPRPHRQEAFQPRYSAGFDLKGANLRLARLQQDAARRRRSVGRGARPGLAPTPTYPARSSPARASSPRRPAGAPAGRVPYSVSAAVAPA